MPGREAEIGRVARRTWSTVRTLVSEQSDRRTSDGVTGDDRLTHGFRRSMALLEGEIVTPWTKVVWSELVRKPGGAFGPGSSRTIPRRHGVGRVNEHRSRRLRPDRRSLKCPRVSAAGDAIRREARAVTWATRHHVWRGLVTVDGSLAVDRSALRSRPTSSRRRVRSPRAP